MEYNGIEKCDSTIIHEDVIEKVKDSMPPEETLII